tara:strand:- start:759 stop:1307 length:549 start_codon:yes stop_codon:yes gene_type:complete
MININIIVAYCKNNGIGYENTLPWYVKSDLRKFKLKTIGNKNNAVIMGKNTYNSLKNKFLVDRDNLILSSSIQIDKIINNNLIKTFSNINILEKFIKEKNYDEIWVIGGEQIYKLFMQENDLFKLNYIYVTFIDKDIKCDTFFPNIDYSNFKFISQEIHKNESNESNENNYFIFDRVYKKII